MKETAFTLRSAPEIPGIRNEKRKAWHEIPDMLICPVIGTCLDIEEQKTICRKCRIPFEGLSDYELHSLLVRSGSSDSTLGRRMHHDLDMKYRKEINLWGCCGEEELLSRWEQDLESGEIAPVLWIAATHPALSDAALNRIFGDVHMLMHRQGESVRLRLRENERLRAYNLYLTEKVRKLQVLRAQAARDLDASEKNRAGLAARLENRAYRTPSEAGGEASEKRIERLEQQVQSLVARMGELKTENHRLSESLNASEAVNRLLSAELMESMRDLKKQEDACAVCPNHSLCEKRVLVVGGMTRAKAAYQTLVETMGGQFRHHDGRRGGGNRALEGHITWADVVLCPVDINSHNACLSVKKLCEKMNKPYRMLPRSGLGSVTRSLREFGASIPKPGDA